MHFRKLVMGCAHALQQGEAPALGIKTATQRGPAAA
jgi:hypothetical protein